MGTGLPREGGTCSEGESLNTSFFATRSQPIIFLGLSFSVNSILHPKNIYTKQIIIAFSLHIVMSTVIIHKTIEEQHACTSNLKCSVFLHWNVLHQRAQRVQPLTATAASAGQLFLYRLSHRALPDTVSVMLTTNGARYGMVGGIQKEGEIRASMPGSRLIDGEIHIQIL